MPANTTARWWFQLFFFQIYLYPSWGNDKIWPILFRWVAQPPTRLASVSLKTQRNHWTVEPLWAAKPFEIFSSPPGVGHVRRLSFTLWFISGGWWIFSGNLKKKLRTQRSNVLGIIDIASLCIDIKLEIVHLIFLIFLRSHQNIPLEDTQRTLHQQFLFRNFFVSCFLGV